MLRPNWRPSAPTLPLGQCENHPCFDRFQNFKIGTVPDGFGDNLHGERINMIQERVAVEDAFLKTTNC